MSFSLQKNKIWSGTGFFLRGTTLELSPLCFATQNVVLGSGKYRVKIIGSSLSGNGIFSLQVFMSDSEVFLKKISFLGKNNTEISFDLELPTSGSFSIKIQRGKESIGRVSISMLNIVKIIEKQNFDIVKNYSNQLNTKEKTFLILDYDILNGNNFFNLFSSLKNKSEVFFLLKTSQNFISKDESLNFKMFFEWDDLFDYLSLFDSKSILYLHNNIQEEIFIKYNVKKDIFLQLKEENISFKNISGILF
jgi:hypothetical protein